MQSYLVINLRRRIGRRVELLRCHALPLSQVLSRLRISRFASHFPKVDDGHLLSLITLRQRSTVAYHLRTGRDGSWVVSRGSIRPDWLNHVVNVVQTAASYSIESVSDVQTILDLMSALEQDVYRPTTPFESLVFRGLRAELLLQVPAVRRLLQPQDPVVKQGHQESPSLDADLALRIHAAVTTRLGETLTARTIGHTVGLHPRVVARLIRNATGRSVHDYIASVRVQEALRRIAATNDKIESIAMTVGFRSKATFYRAVQKLVHIRPSELRARTG